MQITLNNSVIQTMEEKLNCKRFFWGIDDSSFTMSFTWKNRFEYLPLS